MSSLKKYILIFDFDETIINGDSEDDLLKNIFPKKEYDNIMNNLNELDFFEGFNYYFKRMKELNITLKDINQALEKIKLSQKFDVLFNYLKNNKSSYEIIICSSGIDYSIKHILNYYNYLDIFDNIISTKGYLKTENSEKLISVPKNQFNHNCNLCPVSLCKTTEIKKYLEKNKNKFEKILYVGDGSNDFCPAKNLLKKGDIVFPRFNNSLYKMIFENEKKNELKCEIVPWKSGDDIILKLKELSC